MIILRGQMKRVQGLKAKLCKPTGGKGDHYIDTSSYVYSFKNITTKKYKRHITKGSNILPLDQQNVSNWSKNMESFPQFDNSYNDGINNITYTGGAGCERIYLAVDTECNKYYSFEFDFKTSTGFSCSYGSDEEYAFVSAYIPADSSVDLLKDSSVFEKTILSSTASDDTTHYVIDFMAVSERTYIGFDMGYIVDDVVTNLYFSNISLHQVEIKYESEETE